MNNPDVAKQIEQILQKGFYVTLGATSSLFEVMQDSAKLESLVNNWRQELDRLTHQLVDKGVITEVEARNFVDRFMSRNWPGNTPNPPTTSMTTVDTTAVPNNDIQQLADLTKQLADLRAELERLRQ